VVVTDRHIQWTLAAVITLYCTIVSTYFKCVIYQLKHTLQYMCHKRKEQGQLCNSIVFV